MEKKILFTGTTGMVGHYIDQCAWPMEMIKSTRADFDITDVESVNRYVDAHSTEIGMIIHLAAETDVDRCEKDPAHAYRMNTIGTQNMVYQAMKLDVPFTYTCTVGIFGGDGAQGPFHEYSPLSPGNEYARSKLYGEEFVKTHLTRYFVVRPGWMMGGIEKDKKFVMKVIRQLLAGKREIFATTDNVGSLTYAKELIEHISRLITTSWWGVYHCTNTGRISRYEAARVICAAIDPTITVTPVLSTHFQLDAPRALSEYAENRMLAVRGLNRMSTVEQALSAYLDEIKASGFVNVILPKA